MKNFYEILGIDSEASKVEIKRAYFKLVRKYPPDRYEVEFMEIREAYETLSNEKTRKEYDSINYLPTEIKKLYDSARAIIEDGDFSAGIRILEKILKMDSELLIVKSFLAETYLKNDNSGKAIKIYEELTAGEPENASFAGYLAEAYLLRGWQKKAIDAYNRAIELDQDNISLWMGISSAYIKDNKYWEAENVLKDALDRAADISDSTTIYLKLIMIEIDCNKMFCEISSYLDKLTELAVNNIEIRDNVGWTLSHIAQLLMRMDRTEDAQMIIDTATKILPEEKQLLQAKKEIENFVKYSETYKKLDKDNKIKIQVIALIGCEVLPNSVLGMDDAEKKATIFFNEYEILKEYDKFRSSIQKLKKNYPELYLVKADFFNKAENSIERKKAELKYRKQVHRYISIMEANFGLEDYDDEDMFNDDFFGEGLFDEDSFMGDFLEVDWKPQEPIVREEPKIGRNDPCPCGSGKKYKKCCGK